MKPRLFAFTAAFFLAAATATLYAQSYTFTTLAGLPPQTGSTDGTGGDARFYNPEGVATDAGGNVYVADLSNYLIRKITPSGVVTTLAGTAGRSGSADGVGTSAQFGEVYALTVDSAGNVLVSDYGNSTIRKITPDGVVSTLAGRAGATGSTDGTGSNARFAFPYGIAIGSDGNIYVADRGNRLMRKITPGGTVSTIAGLVGFGGVVDGTGSAARFSGLEGLAADGNGNLYVVDNTNSVIRKVTINGVVTTIAGSTVGNANGAGTAAQFNNPAGIACDASGNIYVADTSNYSIRKITPDGTVSRFAGGGFVGYAEGAGSTVLFNLPRGIAVDALGNFYVADRNNQTIRKLTPAAVSSTLAGPGGNTGSSDGTGSAARFYRPRKVVVDHAGNLFVTDSFNATIRKITPTGTVTTFAGTAGSYNYIDATGTAARFETPYGLCIDASDKLFLTDLYYNVVRTITPAGLVRSYCGQPNLIGANIDGTADVARFSSPEGLAIDSGGNLFIADTLNHTIRKVTTDGIVSTYAGVAGVPGSVDGSARSALFYQPEGLAIDTAGNLYVSEFGNSTIRKITPSGVVSTVAGSPGQTGAVDGRGTTARFNNPEALAVDASGNLFVADSNNDTIRKIAPDGTVTTIGGKAITAGFLDGTAGNARFYVPSGIAVDDVGAIYIVNAFNATIVKGVLDTLPGIATQPMAANVLPGGNVTFLVAATGGGLSYQWKHDGVAISGATGSSYTVSSATAGTGGAYTVDVSNSAGMTSSSPAKLTLLDANATPGRIMNLAIRSQAGTDSQTLIVGVVIGGAANSTGNKALLVRGAGPTLAGFGVSGALLDPQLQIYSSLGTKIGENDNWAGNTDVVTAAGAVGAFPFASTSSKDAAFYSATFSKASYTIQISGNGGATGVALAEIYDATPAAAFTATTTRLVNVSARTQVGVDGDILIAGFVLGGQASKTVLIRAVGPTLGGFGVPGALIDPKLELYSGSTKIAENNDWAGDVSLSTAFNSVGAFPLPVTSKDAAIVITLPPGNYTAQVSGVGRTNGVALVEVYDVP
jgi:sugar lactone lactonase YvrE